jgi:hypothetical protein
MTWVYARDGKVLTEWEVPVAASGSATVLPLVMTLMLIAGIEKGVDIGFGLEITLS